ncbi:MAG: LamG-like jellyroll fold domain-containing protein [FCB group bacterium]|jgi:hypothetical protein|nr:LamG-like jellyroll fold domain-containing protein [FCB group bacterium]
MSLCTLAVLATFLGTPLAADVPADGLLVRFDASDSATLTLEDDRVAAWKSTVEPFHAAVASDARQPAFVARSGGALRSAVRFDGIDDVLRVPAFQQKAETWTLVVVAAPATPVGGGGLCSASPEAGHDYDPGLTVDLYQSAGAFDQINVEGAGRIGGQIDQMKSAYPLGSFHVIIVVRSADTVQLYIDGTPEGSRPVNAAQTVMDALRIGSRFYEGKERAFFHGEIAQVLLYGRALAEGERTAIEARLRVSDEEREEGEKAMAAEKEEQRRNRMTAPQVVEAWPNIDAFVKGQSDVPDPETLPIRTDIREAIELSVRHMNSLFNRDKDNEPYFYVNREADGTGKMHHSINIGIPHVVGRCLLACMSAEKDATVPFPEDGLAIFERYCRSSFDNADHLNSYYDPNRGGARFIEFHNMREGLYGLWALIAGRQSQWARETAHEMLVTLDSVTNAEGLWSVELAKERGILERSEGFAPPNTARIVDPLLACYDATQDPLAMKLAAGYARQGLKTLYTEDGHFTPMEQSSGHVHSITSSLSGITDYAVRTDDKAMIDACRKIMENGVPEYFSSWGWGDEVFPEHPANVVSRGEINQTGDVVRAALILGGAGYPDYYDLAERYLRGMILPTQHREKELRAILRDKPEPKDDSERDTVMRSIGGYAMQLPNDRMSPGDWPISTLDITSGAVHAMSEAYRYRTTTRDGAYRVNLLFDFEDDKLVVDSDLPLRGRISFRAKQDIAGLAIRIPQWVNTETVRITVEGESTPLKLEKGYAILDAIPAGKQGELTFDVPCKREKETVDGIAYTTLWVGNQLVDIKPRGTESPLPF